MAIQESFKDFNEGNWFDGFTPRSFLVRSSNQGKGIGGKSLRNKNGKLQLRPNTYNISKYTANFTPMKTSKFVNILRNGRYYYVEQISYSYPQYWTNLTRHVLPNKEPKATQRAKRKFFDKILENKATMAQTFAERQSTINTVAGKLTAVFQAYSSIKKGNVRKACRVLGIKTKKTRSKQAAGQWLELQYGWLPLLGDIHTLLNFNPFAGDTISAGAGDRNTYTGYLGATVQSKEYVEFGAVITVTDPLVGFANQAGLLNPAQVAWELVPFSFVVDWALPIGNHLDYLTALAGLSVSNGYISTKITRDIYMAKPNANGLNISGHEETFTRTLFTKSSLGVPDLEFKNPISPLHLANALALGRQLKKS